MATTSSDTSQDADQAADDDRKQAIVERPDGFYWQDLASGRLYGPFPTLLLARQDMQYEEDSDFGEGESLAEAEAEIGIADWLDPDTGEPAEDHSPHFHTD